MNWWLVAGFNVVVIGIGVWLARRRRSTNLGRNVSARWLSNHEYDRDGDDRLWK